MSRLRIYWGLSVMALLNLLHAQDIDYEVLRGPANLILKNGQAISGKPVSAHHGELMMQSTSGEGQIEYTFSIDEIERLDFPGNTLVVKANSLIDAGELDAAMPILNALYRQRAAYFAYMSPHAVAYFQKFADTAYATGDYFMAVGVARNVRPFVEDATIRRELADRELLAHYHLPLIEKTQMLAEAWTSEWEPYGASALGWYVMGQLAYDREEVENALWLCLKPIVFSSQFPMDYLNHCYALAVIAAVELEDFPEAQRLLAEMKERGFAWPQGEKLSPFEFYFTEGIPKPKTIPNDKHES